MNICEYCDKEIEEANLPVHPECAARWLKSRVDALTLKFFIEKTENVIREECKIILAQSNSIP